jgi:hypothetical protein
MQLGQLWTRLVDWVVAGIMAYAFLALPSCSTEPDQSCSNLAERGLSRSSRAGLDLTGCGLTQPNRTRLHHT